MEDQALYTEQLHWHLYYKKKQEWDDTPASKRHGKPPEEPLPIFSSEEKRPEQMREQYPDIAETVPVENN